MALVPIKVKAINRKTGKTETLLIEPYIRIDYWLVSEHHNLLVFNNQSAIGKRRTEVLDMAIAEYEFPFEEVIYDEEKTIKY